MNRVFYRAGADYRMKIHNLQIICRACLQEGVLNSIFMQHKKLALTYSEMLYYCVSVKVLISNNNVESDLITLIKDAIG